MLTSLACFISSKVKILQFAKGYRGRAKNVLKLARLRVMKALQQMSYDRHRKHANASKIWVARINAGCREHGVAYSRFKHAMNHQNVALNRKMLAELARHEPFSFKALVDQAVVDKVERGVTARLPHMPDPFHTVASHLELQKARQRMGRS